MRAVGLELVGTLQAALVELAVVVMEAVILLVPEETELPIEAAAAAVTVILT
jgi:hypothetical protein